jgi:alpha-mannosidase
MIGLKPGFIKRADVAWYSSHHHDAAGQNVVYAYAYLFAYAIDMQPGTTMLKLPNNDKVRILAISVATENPTVMPSRPLYDELPAKSAGSGDFSISTVSKNVQVYQGRTAITNVVVIPRGGAGEAIHLRAAGVPAGVTAVFTPTTSSGSATITFKAEKNAAPGKSQVTIEASERTVSRSVTVNLEVAAVLKEAVPVNLSSAYNVPAIYRDGMKFTVENSIDGDGSAISAEQAGIEQIGAGVVFKLGPTTGPNGVTSKTALLPAGNFRSLHLLALGLNGSQRMQTFTVSYTDGTSSSFIQTLSDWSSPAETTGESPAAEMEYRTTGDGSKDANPFYTHAYSFQLDAAKTVKAISLPANRDVVVLGISLVPAA